MIERTFDKEKVNSVLKHEDIWQRIADKSIDKESYQPPSGENHYLFEDGILYILHPYRDFWQIHANVIKSKRHKAFDAGQQALDYVFNTLNAKKVIAIIPKKYIDVYKFTMKSGFTDCGTIDGEHYLELRAEKWDS